MKIDPVLYLGDYIAYSGCIPNDILIPPMFSSPTLAGLDITSTLTELAEPSISKGDHLGGVVGYGTIDSGSSAESPVLSMQGLNMAGPLVTVRIRETPYASSREANGSFF